MGTMPKYAMIEEFVKTNIQNGTFKENEPIYTERKLSEMFKVTRMTVRQAINNLVSEGYLYRQKGSGTFVSDRKVTKVGSGLTSFTEDILASGKTPHSSVISLEITECTERAAEKLGIATGDPVYRIERIRYADEVAWGYEIVLRPVHFTPGLKIADLEQSMFKDLESRGLKIAYSDQTIEAVLAYRTTAEYLDISENEPILLIRSVTYLDGNVPLQYTKSFYRGDKYKFSYRAIRD
jgi:GntR family transcriptional regulator